MDITNRRHLHAVAADRLEKARDLPKIALIYGGIVVLSSLFSATVSFFIGQQINNFGGLQNMGTRSILATIQNILPLVIQMVLMALELGFLNVMVRTARGQYASPQSLKLGFDRFWLLFKTTLLESGVYCIALMGSFYLSSQIFMITPLSKGFRELVTPMVETGSSFNPMLMMDDADIVARLSLSMVPLLILMTVVAIAVILPLSYRYRMVNYLVIDKPGIPATLALGESWRMMKHNCVKLFKVDLSLWWYYVALVLGVLLCYGDMLLPLVGINLSMPASLSYFVFLILYLLVNLAIILFLRPRVEVTYALCYDAIRPQDSPQTGGAVLGSSFNM